MKNAHLLPNRTWFLDSGACNKSRSGCSLATTPDKTLLHISIGFRSQQRIEFSLDDTNPLPKNIVSNLDLIFYQHFLWQWNFHLLTTKSQVAPFGYLARRRRLCSLISLVFSSKWEENRKWVRHWTEPDGFPSSHIQQVTNGNPLILAIGWLCDHLWH